VVATVPLGYADGVSRALSATGGEVLVGGRRRPISGTVTMDQILVDCGPTTADDAVSVGDEVVLIGRQGDEVITAWDWANRTGTIAYEVVCGVSGRVPRTYLGG
jgi:alanine racemase